MKWQTDPVGYGDGINWYLYCRNNPLAFVDPGGCKTVNGPVTTAGLIWHYLTGEGDELAYEGSEAWSFVADNIWVSTQIYAGMQPHVEEWWVDPCDSDTFYVSFGVTFPPEPFGSAEFLVHNADMVVTGTWIKDSNGITVDATFMLTDIADLHVLPNFPNEGDKWHPEDTVAFLYTELGWNSFLRNYICYCTVLGWFIDVPEAQPYLLTITSRPTTTYWVVNDNGTAAPVGSLEEWLD